MSAGPLAPLTAVDPLPGLAAALGLHPELGAATR